MFFFWCAFSLRRLAEKGYTAQEKLDKKQHSETQKKKRVAFAKKHLSKDAEAWKKYVQAVADMKIFTYYPKHLKPKHKRLRAKWTYMNAKERYQKPFQRPKRWFAGDDYKNVQKQKVFGFTSSNGKICAFLVNANYTGEMWAKDIDKKLAPFLKKCFPEKSSFRILLDGEGLLHKPVAKAAMRRHGIEVLPGWPGNHEFHNFLLEGSIGIIGAIREIGIKAEDNKIQQNKNRFSSGMEESTAKEEGEEDIL